MVFAMHQIQIAAIARHVDGAPWFEALPSGRRAGPAPRRLGHVGDRDRRRHRDGRSRQSSRARSGTATFEKQAPTVSYGAYADDLLTTLRRRPDAEPGDQVVALTHREPVHARADRHLGPAGDAGHVLARLRRPREFPIEQVLPTPFSTVATESMVPDLPHPVVASLARASPPMHSTERARSSARRRSGDPISCPPTAHGCRSS